MFTFGKQSWHLSLSQTCSVLDDQWYFLKHQEIENIALQPFTTRSPNKMADLKSAWLESAFPSTRKRECRKHKFTF